MMANIYDVSNLLTGVAKIDADAGSGDLITPLKLQKLLFYIQGYYLAMTGKPLFENDFVAWQYGPVVEEVYRHYCHYNMNGIDELNDIDPDALSNEQMDIISSVMLEYGKYSAGELVNMTHRPGTPWSSTERGNVIGKDLIKTYFETMPPLPLLKDRVKKIPVEEPVRYDNGIPVYSKEFEKDWNWDE